MRSVRVDFITWHVFEVYPQAARKVSLIKPLTAGAPPPWKTMPSSCSIRAPRPAYSRSGAPPRLVVVPPATRPIRRPYRPVATGWRGTPSRSCSWPAQALDASKRIYGLWSSSPKNSRRQRCPSRHLGGPGCASRVERTAKITHSRLKHLIIQIGCVHCGIPSYFSVATICPWSESQARHYPSQDDSNVRQLVAELLRLHVEADHHH